MHPSKGVQRPSAALHPNPTSSPKPFASGFVVAAPTVPSVPARLSGTVSLFSRSSVSPPSVSRLPALRFPPLPPPSSAPTAVRLFRSCSGCTPPLRNGPRPASKLGIYTTARPGANPYLCIRKHLPLHTPPLPLRSTPCMGVAPSISVSRVTQGVEPTRLWENISICSARTCASARGSMPA